MKNIFVLGLLFAMVGCTSTQNHPTVTGGSTCKAVEGVILDIQSVTIERNTEVAQSIGAGLGGYVANRATKDKDEVVEVLATAIGAGAGAVIGDKVADATQDLQGKELIVQMDSGVHSIIQQDVGSFQSGDKVWVIGFAPRNYYRRNQCGEQVRVMPRS